LTSPEKEASLTPSAGAACAAAADSNVFLFVLAKKLIGPAPAWSKPVNERFSRTWLTTVFAGIDGNVADALLAPATLPPVGGSVKVSALPAALQSPVTLPS